MAAWNQYKGISNTHNLTINCELNGFLITISNHCLVMIIHFQVLNHNLKAA
jgi:hypothetical protein